MKNTLKVERAKRNLTQSDLAALVKVSKQTIHSIESGRYTPSTIIALRLARCFGTPVEELFHLEPGDDE